MNSRKFIRFWIPALLIAVLAVVAVFEHLILVRQREARRTDEVVAQAGRQAAWLAGLAAKAQQGDDSALQAALAYLAEDLDVKYALVCATDSHRPILRALPSEWAGRPLMSTGADDATDIVRLVQKTRDPQGRAYHKQDIAIAAHPVAGGTPSQPNVAVIERDLSLARDLARRGAAQDFVVVGFTTSGLAAVLWIVFLAVLRREERRTRTAEGRQLVLADNLGAAVVTVRADRIESINTGGLRLLGARVADQVAGRSPFDFVHAESQQQVRDLIRSVSASGTSPPPTECRVVRIDGTTAEANVSAVPLEGVDGAVQLFLTDMTAQKEQEASRVALSRDLEEKNRELEAIVYAASHDLRSPLLNVMGFSQQLDTACRRMEPLANGKNGGTHEELGTILHETVPRALKFIEQGVTRMDSLLTGFLRYSRVGRQQIEPQTLDMDAMFRSIASTFAYQMQEAGANLRVEDLPPCTGDPMQINQLFSNLVDNAIKYRKPGVPCVIHVTGRREGGDVLYSVTDNGAGIAPEHQRIIFEIFHRLNPAAVEGEGLGLTIAQRIARRHNGSISVVSQPGVGSTFTVRLPAPA